MSHQNSPSSTPPTVNRAQPAIDDQACSKRAASSLALMRRLDYPLLTAAVLLRDRIESALVGFEITIPQLGVLILLSDTGPLSQTEIASQLQLDPTQVVRHIDRLEESQLVERQADPKDRRAHRVVITPTGRKVRHDADQAARRAEHAYKTKLSDREREEMHQLLRKLVDGSAVPASE